MPQYPCVRRFLAQFCAARQVADTHSLVVVLLTQISNQFADTLVARKECL